MDPPVFQSAVTVPVAQAHLDAHRRERAQPQRSPPTQPHPRGGPGPAPKTRERQPSRPPRRASPDPRRACAPRPSPSRPSLRRADARRPQPIDQRRDLHSGAARQTEFAGGERQRSEPSWRLGGTMWLVGRGRPNRRLGRGFIDSRALSRKPGRTHCIPIGNVEVHADVERAGDRDATRPRGEDGSPAYRPHDGIFEQRSRTGLLTVHIDVLKAPPVGASPT
jgi:hypothetical protein